MSTWKKSAALAIVALSWLLLLTIGQGTATFDPTPEIHPWVWLEAEEFADTNFPHASRSTRGEFCYTRRGVGYDTCSGDEHLLFLSGRPGRPFDPPGYWYADYALRVPAPGDYGHVWLALSPHDAAFSWSVDAQSPITATIIETAPPYGDPTFHWVRLDPVGLDLNLSPDDNPHTLTLRRDDPEAPWLRIDAIVLTSDETWTPSGIEKPAVDRSYLDPYPDYALYARSYLEHILPDTVPEANEITATISSFVTPGEYEPLSFAIYAQRTLTEVVVSVASLTSDLARVPILKQSGLPRPRIGGMGAASAGDFGSAEYVHGAHVAPASEIDLRVVRVVAKRLDNHSTPEETELAPEILDYNTPQDIPAETSKQYWLIVHVPSETPPGDYQGTITVAPANAPAATLNMTLTVLPFTLQESPTRSHGVGYRPLLSFDGVTLPGDPFDYMRQDLADHRAHGMDSGSVYTPVSVTLASGDEVVVDYTDLERHMDLLVELGFDAPAAWRGIGFLSDDLQALGVPTDTLEATYVEVVHTVLEKAEEKSWPEIYFFPVDEPFGHPEKEAEFYWLAPLIKQVPGALVLVSLDGAETLPPEADPFTDVRFYSGWSADGWLPLHPFEEIAADAAASGDRLAFYYNTRSVGGRPEFSRVTFGLYAWNSPFLEQSVWIYQAFHEDPYDDTDGRNSDLAYAYPDPERSYAPTIPTLRWEGVREGIDDLRYLYTLEQAIEAAEGDPAKAEAVAAAHALLDSLRADLNRYGPEARGIIAYFEPEDYRRYRWEMAQAILMFKQRIYLPLVMK